MRGSIVEVPIPDCFQPPESDANIAKRVRVRTQAESARANGHVICVCGTRRHVRQVYKCLYCGEWFCKRCAEIHFGQTVAEYQKEHPQHWRGAK